LASLRFAKGVSIQNKLIGAELIGRQLIGTAALESTDTLCSSQDLLLHDHAGQRERSISPFVAGFARRKLLAVKREAPREGLTAPELFTLFTLRTKHPSRARARGYGDRDRDAYPCTLMSSHSYAPQRRARQTCRRYMSARKFSARCATSVEFARTLLSLLSSISVCAKLRTSYQPPRISPEFRSLYLQPFLVLTAHDDSGFCRVRAATLISHKLALIPLITIPLCPPS